MTIADRWLLPDGVEELLPAEAEQAESLRRKLLDLYRSWGYQLVMPPLIEFTESLLVGLGSDVDLQTFKVTDQMTGRAMGIRADITPQTARIDAHSLKQDGPVRLCYAGSVLHTKPKTLMASRSPIQLGAELYGDASLNSDIEIICLMLETLRCAGVENITLDLGHVAVYAALIERAALSADDEKTLFDALQRKAVVEIESLITNSVKDTQVAEDLRSLSQLQGDIRVLDKAGQLSADVSAALAELRQTAELVQARMPDVNIYFDLSELRGFHYHTGLVFAAYAPGFGHAVANGGRCDDIGEVFGRSRPAIGFSTDLKTLLKLLPADQVASKPAAIFAPASDDLALWQTVQKLRAQGEQVICGLDGEQQAVGCNRQLQLENGEWQVKPL
jgi:ATP phosphoribosyltransferase regulatory subunit